MKANKLYHFIHLNTSLIQKNSPIPFQAEAIGSFIKVALQKPTDLNVLSITLPDGNYNFEPEENAHATFFETVSASNPTLSEYHYTAYFTEKDYPGSYFQLHVYFNNKDQLTTQPQLTEHRGDGTHRFVPLGDAEAIFQSLALKYTHELIVPIRLSIHEKIRQDKALYAEMTEVLDELSKDRDENPEPYLAEIERHILFIENMILYQSNQRAWAGIQTMLNHQANMVKEKAQSSTGPTEHKESSDSPSVALEKEDADTEILVIHPNTTPPPKAVRQELSIFVQAAKEAMDLYLRNLQSCSLQENARALSSAIQLTQEASLYAMDTTYQKTPADLLILQRLLFIQEQHKEQLLTELLLADHFTEAELLLDHWKEDGCLLSIDIACKLITTALENSRHQLLAFILENTDFPINTFTMQREMGNITAAMYCFLNGSPSSAKCLSVLIHHGASLMEPCPGTGLPLAHSIMSADLHPAMLALRENRERTLSNCSFFIQLIRLLKAQPATQEIKNSIRRYEMILQALGLQKDKSAIALQQNHNISIGLERLVENPGFLNNPNFILLQSDPEFRIKYEELQLYQGLSLPKTRNSEMQREIYQKSMGMLELLNAHPDILKIPYAAFKKECLEELQTQINVFELLERSNKKGLTKGARLPTDKESKGLQRHIAQHFQTKKKEAQEGLKEAKATERTHKKLGIALDHMVEGLNHLQAGLKFFKSNIDAFDQSVEKLKNQDPATISESDIEGLSDNLNASLQLCETISQIKVQQRDEHTECDRDDDDRIRKTIN